MASWSIPAGAPYRFGVVLFPQYEILDIAGPLEALTVLSRADASNSLSLVTLAEDASKPVSSRPVVSGSPGSNFEQHLVPTHSFKDCPPLDVLLLPGGIGAGDSERTPPAIPAVVEFIREIFPSLKYLITVCNGAGIAARAGVLDGKTCTTNKFRWQTTTALGPKTHWVAKARWVDDGKVWTTSGVSAGTDGVIEWMAKTYGEEVVETACMRMEYVRQKDSSDDPFSQVHKCADVPPVQ